MKGGTMKRKKERIQITMDPLVLKRLDAYCDRIGCSRSSFLNTTIAERLDGIDRTYGALLSTASDVLKHSANS
jgi:hypothetical protein